jgi:hypothetical protein
MDSALIHKQSEKLKHYVEWMKPGETEWIYCGAGEEIKADIVQKEFDEFFDNTNFFNIAITRGKSFSTDKAHLFSSLTKSIGSIKFFVWTEDYQKAMEFSRSGVFRKGNRTNKRYATYPKMDYHKIGPGSPDKVKGKLVKYRKGDCLSINCADGRYLAALVSEKFNKYYDLTLIEYLNERKPAIDDFINGRFFGNYFDGMDGFRPIVERKMMACLDVDSNPAIEKIGSLELIEPLENKSYGYMKNVDELFDHYVTDLPLRIQRTINFEKRPDIVFISARLIHVREIIKDKNAGGSLPGEA